jgi:hypothetical protein
MGGMMSTRCQIAFYEKGSKLENWEALIYRHGDGYPDTEHGVLADVLPILEDFDKKRGLDDIEYASAWLVAKLKTHMLNIGICRDLHADIEYFYAIYPDKIQVYQPINRFEDFWNNPETSKLKRIKTVKFKWQTREAK